MLKIIIGGDLVPTQSNIELFRSGDVTSLLGDELLTILNAVDVRFFNLEVPLCDKDAPIAKCGPNLIAPIDSVKGIKAVNPSLLTLANNHILDHGIEGLKSTERVLTENSIPYVGVGDNLYEASKPYIFQKDGLIIGFYACADHEFSIATENTPGANPFDPLESLDHILSLKEKCDYVIVLYHGGKEHYRYPSPYLQKVCRKMIKKGADLVVCQHSHCIGCYEEYDGSTIVYGQGNFLFDRSDSEYWQTSLLIKVSISDGHMIEYIPIVKDGNAVRVADKKQREDILQGFWSRSNEIQTEDFVEQQYIKFAGQMFRGYLVGLHGDNLIFRALNKIFRYKLTNKLYSKKSLLRIRNIIECEALRELILKGLSEYGDNR